VTPDPRHTIAVDPTSVTVAIPVGDLEAARAWYDGVLGRPADLEPVPGIAEYEFGGTWVQLVEGRPGPSGWRLRYGVSDLDDEWARLQRLGADPGAIETVPGVIRFFGFADPDGNELSCYQVLAEPA
jgi:predicted enzyme related to lactoylglutathione lyase